MTLIRQEKTIGDLRASRRALLLARCPSPVADPLLRVAWRTPSLRQDRRFIHPTDSSFFWAILFAAPLVWAILGFLALITLKIMWGLLIGDPPCPARPVHCSLPLIPAPANAVVAFMCNAVNVVGYVKCKKDARKKLSALGGSVMLKGMEMWGRKNAGGA